MPVGRIARRQVDGILLLDKPLGLSSNQALQQAKRLFRAEKAGHTGSLDPLATGMLPICFGEATKLCGLLLDSDKSYVALMRLGRRTTTGDAEGEGVAESDTAGVTQSDLEAVRSRFLGTITQIPPMYSALKHEGRRLYELARAGEEVERAPRQVHIHALSFGPLSQGEVEVRVRCSKGTYIRTLVEDLAAAMGQCAHLGALRRESVDPFASQRMYAMEALEQASGTPDLDRLLLPLSSAVVGWPSVTLDPLALARMSRGQSVSGGEELPDVAERPVAILDPQGVLRAVARRGSEGQLSPKRWLGGTATA